MAEMTHPIQEAERYLSNARNILSEKAEKDGNYYNDSKYVRMAGNTAWNGVLVALDAAFDFPKYNKRKKRLDIKDYQNAMAKKDPKMTRPLHSVYETLHLSLGYDGNPDYKLSRLGFERAQEMINWAAKNYHQN